jgi:hypothetical protein
VSEPTNDEPQIEPKIPWEEYDRGDTETERLRFRQAVEDFCSDSTDHVRRGRASYLVMSVLYLEEARRMTDEGARSDEDQTAQSHRPEMAEEARELWKRFVLRPN